jgi:hypothetical protein
MNEIFVIAVIYFLLVPMIFLMAFTIISLAQLKKNSCNKVNFVQVFFFGATMNYFSVIRISGTKNDKYCEKIVQNTPFLSRQTEICFIFAFSIKW